MSLPCADDGALARPTPVSSRPRCDGNARERDAVASAPDALVSAAGCPGGRPPDVLRAPVGSRGEPDGELRRARSGRLHGALGEDPGGRDPRGEAVESRRRSSATSSAGPRTTSATSGTGSAGSIGARASPRRHSARSSRMLRERPLFAHVAEHNIGSIRVLEKCGFSCVGGVELPERGGDGAPLPARGSSGLRDDRVARAAAEPADRPGARQLDRPLDVAQPDEADPGPCRRSAPPPRTGRVSSRPERQPIDHRRRVRRVMVASRCPGRARRCSRSRPRQGSRALRPPTDPRRGRGDRPAAPSAPRRERLGRLRQRPDAGASPSRRRRPGRRLLGRTDHEVDREDRGRRLSSCALLEHRVGQVERGHVVAQLRRQERD